MTVIGAGSCGTAFAYYITLASGHRRLSCGATTQNISRPRSTIAHNVAFLPDVPFPRYVAHGKRLVARESRAGGQSCLFWWWCQAMFSACCGRLNADASGCASGSGRPKAGSGSRGACCRMSLAALGDQIPLAVISGPTFAKSWRRVCGGNLAGATDGAFAGSPGGCCTAEKVFASISMRIFIGVQLGGAVKRDCDWRGDV